MIGDDFLLNRSNRVLIAFSANDYFALLHCHGPKSCTSTQARKTRVLVAFFSLGSSGREFALL